MMSVMSGHDFRTKLCQLCRENYGDSFGVLQGIYDVTAKIFVVSTIYV